MAKKIEHIDRENLEYFAKAIHKEILDHFKGGGGGGSEVSYDPETNTLTIDGVSYDMTGDQVSYDPDTKTLKINEQEYTFSGGGCDCEMTKDAQEYFQEQYNKMFSKEYTFSVSLTASPSSINTQTVGESETITLTATFSAKKITKTPSGSTETSPAIASVTNMPSGWTKVSATKYTKTETLSDFSKNKSYSVSGTINLVDDPEEGATVGSNSVSKSVTVTMTKVDVWFNDLSTIDAASFNDKYKTASTFNTGKGKEFQTISGLPLIFCSTSQTRTFEQSGNTIILENGQISTSYGTYYWYKTGPGNGSIWNSVTIG